MPESNAQHKGGGLSIQTLLISAAAAVAAATVVPMIWERGTILATAMTPIVVALVSEALRKPVQTVSAVAPKVTTRRSGTGAAVRRFDPDAARTRDQARVGARGDGPERFEPLPPGRRGEEPPTRDDDPFGLRAESRSPGRHWKIAVVTGLLAFVIAAGFITFTELAARRLRRQRPPHQPVRRLEVVDADAHRHAGGHRGRRRGGDAGSGGDRDAGGDGHRDADPHSGGPGDSRAHRDPGRPRADALTSFARWRRIGSRPPGWLAPPVSPAWRPGRPRASSARARRTSRAPRRGGRRRSSAATWRPPSRS